MDPSLEELLLEISDPEEELEVLMRLVLPSAVPDKVKMIAQFGDVITCRIKRKDMEEVYASPLKFSIKASKYFGQNRIDFSEEVQVKNQASSTVQGKASDLKASDVIVACIDWGCDFTHPNLRNSDGSTRILGLWDQSFTKNKGVKPYGYGTFYNRNHINAALKSGAPFRFLNYHPSKADTAGIGAHGTHVMDIAAGNGSVGKPGIAPNVQLAFVHLSANDTGGVGTLGDSVRIMEAIDFLRRLAGNHPLVINVSVGRHGGPHDGNTLVERAIDNFLEERKDTMICQSTGNYFTANTHAAGKLKPGRGNKLSFEVHELDKTPNEIEIWYSGKDQFEILLRKDDIRVSAKPGETKNIIFNHQLVGRLYHRVKDPVNLKNHINIFLYQNAPPGVWDIFLSGSVLRDGRYHAWIERDSGSKKNQARFLPRHAEEQNTTGTICNGFNSLVVGAYDAASPTFQLGSFSSMGPTTDGRCKPDLIAPGVKIVAARSARKGQLFSTGELTLMSGTSMAAPHVAGVVARIMQILPPGTPYYVIRNIINGSATRLAASSEDHRIGNGLLNLNEALRKAQLYVKSNSLVVVSNPVTVTQKFGVTKG